MRLQARHIALAALLHAVLFGFLFVGVQCSQPIPPTPVVQGVLITPAQLQQYKPPVQNPAPAKPEDTDQGPQQVVQSPVVTDTAKEEQEKAAAAQKQQEEQKEAEQAKAAEVQRQKDEQAKAEELKRVEEAQKQAAEEAELKKQEEDAKRKAEADAAAKAKADAEAKAAAEAEAKKELDEQLRKEAQEKQEAQAAMLAQKQKAAEAQQAAERRKRAQEELQKSLGVESAQLTAAVTDQWRLALIAALTQAWARPPGTDSNLKAYVIITLAQGSGQVLNASIDNGSGMSGFDDSVVSAAYKASPMPLPADPSAFHSKVEVCFSPNPRNCQQ
jgi:colicin import membrane protein